MRLLLFLCFLFLADTASGDVLSITPSTQTQSISGEAFWTCTLRTDFGLPIPGRFVTAILIGPNGPQTLSAQTNGSGLASFTFDPRGPGSNGAKGFDDVQCLFDTGRDIAESPHIEIAWQGEESISIFPANQDLDVSQFFTVSCTVTDDFGQPVVGRSILFALSGPNGPGSANLATQSNGISNFGFDPAGSGDATIGTDVVNCRTSDGNGVERVSPDVTLTWKYLETLTITPLSQSLALFRSAAFTCSARRFNGDPISGQAITNLYSGVNGSGGGNFAADTNGDRNFTHNPNGSDDALPGIDSMYCRMTDSNGEFVNSETAEIEWIPNPIVSLNVKLAGPYNVENFNMSTQLANDGHVPNAQPFNAAPWSYSGSELFTTLPEFAVDWVLVSLRSASDPEVDMRRMAALVNAVGDVITVDGSGDLEFVDVIAEDSYYIVVEHRNHLSAMTPFAISKAADGPFFGKYRHNFGTGSSYGVNGLQKIDLGGGFSTYGLWSGDGDRNGSVTAFDFTNVWLPSNGASPAYLYADFNLDGQVTAFDFIEAWLPANGSASQVP